MEEKKKPTEQEIEERFLKMESKEIITAKELLLSKKLANNARVKDYVSPDGYIWKAIIAAMEEYASLLLKEKEAKITNLERDLKASESVGNQLAEHIKEKDEEIRQLKAVNESAYASLKLNDQMHKEEIERLKQNLRQPDVMRSVCCNEELVRFKTYGYDECIGCGNTYKQQTQ